MPDRRNREKPRIDPLPTILRASQHSFEQLKLVLGRARMLRSPSSDEVLDLRASQTCHCPVFESPPNPRRPFVKLDRPVAGRLPDPDAGEERIHLLAECPSLLLVELPNGEAAAQVELKALGVRP